MAENLPRLTAPGPELVSARAGAWEGLCPKASFRQGDEQVPPATFHPAHTTAVQPYRSSKALYYCLHPASSENLFPQGSLCSFFAIALYKQLLFIQEMKKTFRD